MTAEILYVEDNPGEVFLLREAVRRLNENVRLVTRRRWRSGPFPPFIRWCAALVIVLDLNLPRIDGTEVLRVVKSTRNSARFPL